MDPDIIEQLNEQFREMSDILSQQNSLMAAQVRNMNAMSGGVNTATGSIRNNTNATDDNTQSTRELTEQQRKHSETINKFDSVIKTTTDGLGGFAAALLNTTQGMTKYADAVGQFGNTVADWGKQSNNIFGYITGQLTKVSTMALQEELKRTENALKFNDTLSKMGAANRFSTDEIAKMGETVGLTRANLDRMLDPMKKLGSTFQAMGSGTADAMKKYSELLSITEKERRELTRLGYADDEQRFEALGTILEASAAAGLSIRSMSKDTDSLRKSSMEYVRNLNTLAELTGKSTEELEKEKNARIATTQFQVWARQETLKAMELRDAGRKKEAEAIESNVRKAGQMVSMFEQFLGKEQSILLQQAIALKGTVTYAPGIEQAAIAGTLGQLQNLGKSINEGNADLKTAALLTLDSVNKQNEVIKGPLGYAAVFDENAAKLANVNNPNLLLGQNQLLNMSPEQLAKMFEDAEKATKENEEGKGPAAEDPAQEIRSDLIQFEKYVQDKVDSLLRTIGPLGLAFVGLAAAATTASIALASSAIGGGILSRMGAGGLVGKITGATAGAAGATAAAGTATAASAGSSILPRTPKIITEGGQAFAKAPGSNILTPLGMHSPTPTSPTVASTVAKPGIMSRIGTAGRFLGRLATPLTIAAGAYTAYSGYTEAQELEAQGKITEDEAAKMKGGSVGRGIGGVGGALGGAKLGAMAGSLGGPLGMAIGGILGGAVGYFAGDKLGGLIGESISGASDRVSKDAEQKKKQNTLHEPTNLDRAFSRAVTSFGRITTSFGRIVTAYGKTTIGFIKASKNIESSLGNLSKIGVTDSSKSSEHIKLDTQTFNKAVASFGNMVISFGRIVSAHGKITTAEINTEKNLEKNLKELSKLGKNPQAKGKLLGTFGEDEEEETLADYIERLKNEFKKATVSTSEMMDVEIKRHNFNEMSMLKFRQSVEDLTKKFDELAKIDVFSGYNDSTSLGGGGGSSNSTLLDSIAKAEGTYDTGYNTSLGNGRYLPGGKEMNLTDMTLDEILKVQKQMLRHPDNNFNSSALGRYQIVSTTLREAAKSLGMDLETTKFDERTQDQMAMWIAKRQGLGAWEGFKKHPELLAQAQKALDNPDVEMANVSAQGSDSIVELGKTLQRAGLKITGHSQFGGVERGRKNKNSRHFKDLAIDINAPGGIVEANDPEWSEKFDRLAAQLKRSGFAVLWKEKGHYDHIHASVGPQYPGTGQKIRAAQGGVFDGPSSGYPAELHGSEMVAPLDTNSILMKLATTPASATPGDITTATSTIEKEIIEKISTTNQETMLALIDKMDDLINAVEQGNDVRDKMFKTSMI